MSYRHWERVMGMDDQADAASGQVSQTTRPTYPTSSARVRPIVGTRGWPRIAPSCDTPAANTQRAINGEHASTSGAFHACAPLLLDPARPPAVIPDRRRAA